MDPFVLSVLQWDPAGGGNYSTFINSEALSHFNLLKKEQMFLVQQIIAALTE